MNLWGQTSNYGQHLYIFYRNTHVLVGMVKKLWGQLAAADSLYTDPSLAAADLRTRADLGS